MPLKIEVDYSQQVLVVDAVLTDTKTHEIRDGKLNLTPLSLSQCATCVVSIPNC